MGHELLPSLVIVNPASLSTARGVTLKWQKRGISETAHVKYQQRDAKAIRRHQQADANSWRSLAGQCLIAKGSGALSHHSLDLRPRCVISGTVLLRDAITERDAAE
jgi:hypothetical protein